MRFGQDSTSSRKAMHQEHLFPVLLHVRGAGKDEAQQFSQPQQVLRCPSALESCSNDPITLWSSVCTLYGLASRREKGKTIWKLVREVVDLQKVVDMQKAQIRRVEDCGDVQLFISAR